MTDLYLKVPTASDEAEWRNFVRDYTFDNPYARPLGCLEFFNYEDWLKKVTDSSNGVNLEENEVKSSTYFLMKEDRILGYVSLRHTIDNEMLSLYGGHIGYGIRPGERRKGYASKMLNLALEKCRELELDEVMITCKTDNIGSAKTIENNCGKLNGIVYIPEENAKFRIYNINVAEALEKEKEKVKKY